MNFAGINQKKARGECLGAFETDFDPTDDLRPDRQGLRERAGKP